MAWSTIRTATTEDTERLAAMERRFRERHGVDISDIEAAIREGSVYVSPTRTLWVEEARVLRRTYRQAVHRALRSTTAEGIAYGYVGSHAGAE